MLKIEEIREMIETKKTEARGLLDTDLAKAETLTVEVRDLQKKLDLATELENEERKQLENQKNNEEKRGNETMDNKQLEYRAAVKLMMGKELTEEERAIVANVVSNSGAIMPTGFINEVQLLRKGYKALKDYCHVLPVTTNSGKMPIATVGGELADLAEDVEMVKGMLATTPVEYSVKDFGLLKGVANNVLEDSPVEFLDGVVAVDFTESAINTENKKIVALANSKSSPLTLGSKKIEAVLESTISKVVPSLRKGLVIITNAEGYAYIDNLKDAQGRILDIVTEGANGELYFKGKEVIDMDDILLPALTDTKTMVFYLVNTKALVKFFDRKGYEISKSTEAGFTLNQTLVKVIERFDVKDADNRANFKLEA